MVADILSQAYEAMRFNRRRTTLTMLGMAWGIATVVLLLAYGNGFGRAIEAIFAQWGTRIIGVFPGRTSQQAGGQKAGTQVKFTMDDVDRIVNAAPMVRRISPAAYKQSTVQYDVRSYTFNVEGIYPSMFKIQAMHIDEGQFFNEQDEEAKARVAVIGSETKTKLFSGQYALGTVHPNRRRQLQSDWRSGGAHAGRRRRRQSGHRDSVLHHERLEEHPLSRWHLGGLRGRSIRTSRASGASGSRRSVPVQARRQARRIRLQHDEAASPVPGHHHGPQNPARLHRDADARALAESA